MRLTKCVNGTHVPLDEEEEQAIKAEWLANSSLPKPPRQPTMADVIAVLTLEQRSALESRISNG